MRDIQYSIIVPVYNEELVIQVSYERLTKVMKEANESYELIFVNDGSKDNTIKLIEAIAEKDHQVKVINFSRNFGHQPAITAGMQYAIGKAIVVIDADLQDPPEVILKMIEKWKEGFDIVYGKRLERKGETFFKKVTAKSFYRTLDYLTDVQIPVDVGDFRLIDRKVCDALNSLPERDRYVRGLVSWVGFKQTAVEFVREERFAGETKYPLKKMIKFAMDGITSFSYKPLKLATYLGVTVSGGAFIYLIYVICQKLFTDSTVEGWASLIGINLLFNGIILIMLGIIGEYIGRIYNEAKGRPLYIVSELKGFQEEELVSGDSKSTTSKVFK
jgi:dolichol-phosphate mannosyltransferase